MSHYVYENWTLSKAVVHTGTCGACNEGRGIRLKDSGRNGKWHGPFDDREAAMAFARSRRHPDTRFCARCAS